jgi:hypothetical protein
MQVFRHLLRCIDNFNLMPRWRIGRSAIDNEPSLFPEDVVD